MYTSINMRHEPPTIYTTHMYINIRHKLLTIYSHLGLSPTRVKSSLSPSKPLTIRTPEVKYLSLTHIYSNHH